MYNAYRRITLIARGSASPVRNWNADPESNTRLIFVDGLAVLEYALRNAMSEFSQDVERVILDRATTATQYLDLLAKVPHEFSGDILMIRYDDSGFLSATGRGGDRLLYSMNADDLLFYLGAQDLITRPLAASIAA